jgi:ribose transport system substrate-binding protein
MIGTVTNNTYRRNKAVNKLPKNQRGLTKTYVHHQHGNRRLHLAATVAALASASLALCTPSYASASVSYGPPIGAAGSGPVTKTVGPNGEPAVPASSVTLTASEVAALKRGHYTAAMAWHEAATFTSGVTDGADAEFKALGIRVVATTQANFNAATQVNQLQTIEALHPNAILSLPVNPVSEASAYRQLAPKGIKLVLLSNVPAGFKYPTQYAGMVTDDLSNMGKQAAELLGRAMGGHGGVGFMYYDANYYVTNERDAAFRTWLHILYPKIHIVVQEAMPDPNQAGTVATAMLTRYPDIQGIYVPWSAPPAEEVLASLRSLGRHNVKVVTMDLDPSIDANLCQGKYLVGIVADQPYLLGETLAKEAALAILGKQVPRFAVVEALPVTKATILQVWKETLAQPAPSNVAKACSGA